MMLSIFKIQNKIPHKYNYLNIKYETQILYNICKGIH